MLQKEMKFEVFCFTKFSESLAIVGSLPELGNWTDPVDLETFFGFYPKWTSDSFQHHNYPLESDYPKANRPMGLGRWRKQNYKFESWRKNLFN